jgi:hypothetical protein
MKAKKPEIQPDDSLTFTCGSEHLGLLRAKCERMGRAYREVHIKGNLWEVWIGPSAEKESAFWSPSTPKGVGYF